MKRSTAALIVVVVSLAAHLAAQGPTVLSQAPKSSARISGRVVAAASGRPLVRAAVRLQAIGNPQLRPTVTTDSNGNYEIVNLPAGRYSFVVSRTGYLDQNFDQPNPLARYRLLELAEGEQLDGMDFSLHRGGVVTGVITDEAGDPFPDVHMTVMREQFGPAGRGLVPQCEHRCQSAPTTKADIACMPFPPVCTSSRRLPNVRVMLLRVLAGSFTRGR